MPERNSSKLGGRLTRRGLGLTALVGSALGLTARPGEAHEDQGYGSVPTPETPDGNTLVPSLNSDGVKQVTLTAAPVNQVLQHSSIKFCWTQRANKWWRKPTA